MSKVSRITKRWTAQQALDNLKMSKGMLTPDIAMGHIAASKDGNRDPNHTQVCYLSYLIMENLWHLGVDALKIDINGVFFGGHHTCLAVIKTRTAVPIVTFEGLEPSTRLYDNQGKPNTLSSELKLSGLQHASKRAAYLRIAVDLISDVKVPLRTLTEYHDWSPHFAGMESIVSLFAGREHEDKYKASVPGTVVAAYNKDPQAVMKFANGVATGTQLKKGDPALLFRQWYTKGVTGKIGKAGGASVNQTISYMTMRYLWAQIEDRSIAAAPTDGGLIAYFRQPFQTKSVDDLLAPWRGPKVAGLGGYIKEIKVNAVAAAKNNPPPCTRMPKMQESASHASV